METMTPEQFEQAKREFAEKCVISPYNLAHLELDEDCCGVFNVLQNDGTIICNECGMKLNDAIKMGDDKLRRELIKYEIYHKNAESSAIVWIDEYLKNVKR